MATEDARYQQSSQYRLWSFNHSQLREMRSKTNSMAKTHISARLTQLASTASNSNDHSAPSPDPAAGAAVGGATSTPADLTLPEFLTPEEESRLLTFYTAELLRAAAFCELPTDIRATSAIFLRRFYVTNSIMTYPPTEMLKTALFFGSKSGGHYTRLQKFADKFPNTSPQEVLAGEYLLCQGIRFAFDVRHPFRALEGAVMELKRMGGVDRNQLFEAQRRARDILKFSPLMTDAYFHYTPSQIMMAALSLADRGLVERLLQQTFHVPDGDETPAPGAEDTTPNPAASALPDIRDKVLGTIEACREMLATEPPERFTEYWGLPEANKAVRPLIKKLKKCRDPDRWNLVDLQRQKREQIMGGGKGASEVASAAASSSAAVATDSDGGIFGTGGKAGGGDSNTAIARRRKGLEDPFGPQLS